MGEAGVKDSVGRVLAVLRDAGRAEDTVRRQQAVLDRFAGFLTGRGVDTASERVWQLPLIDEYRENLKSDVADLNNVGPRGGGAITAVMLACYPELFAGGAIIAGLAFGVADGIPEALERMRGAGRFDCCP